MAISEALTLIYAGAGALAIVLTVFLFRTYRHKKQQPLPTKHSRNKTGSPEPLQPHESPFVSNRAETVKRKKYKKKRRRMYAQSRRMSRNGARK